jgi:hypothetical protein
MLSRLMTSPATSSYDRFERLRIMGPPLDTIEVRWFAAGQPHSSLVEWFSEGGQSAFVEVRRDAYRATLDHGVGLKRRDHGSLELKRRRGLTRRQLFAGGFEGRIEEWRKTGLEEPLAAMDWQWLVVDKIVLTRTFTIDDSDTVTEAAVPELASPACDIEVATISVNETVAWSFALEARGPFEVRRRLLEDALSALIGRSPPLPVGFVAALNLSMGYPEWLASVAGAIGSSPSGTHRAPRP